MSHTRMDTPLYLVFELPPFDYFTRLYLYTSYLTLWTIVMKLNSNVY